MSWLTDAGGWWASHCGLGISLGWGPGIWKKANLAWARGGELADSTPPWSLRQIPAWVLALASLGRNLQPAHHSHKLLLFLVLSTESQLEPTGPTELGFVTPCVFDCGIHLSLRVELKDITFPGVILASPIACILLNAQISWYQTILKKKGGVAN